MKTILVACILSLVAACGGVSPNPKSSTDEARNSQTATDGDLVVLAGSWWGSSVSEFPAIAGLGTGEYAVTPDPVNPNFQIIVVGRAALERWSPKELPPLSFKFSPSEGLFDISGFYKGSQDELLSILRSRYGEPAAGGQAFGMKAYGWKIGKTYLDLRHGIFVLSPLRR